MKRVLLAYSGGLDTSVMIPWLKEHYGCEVIAFCADLGQEEFEGLEERALAAGASSLIIKDLKQEFLKDYAFKGLKAGAKYEGKYLLGTALARPLIAKALAQKALELGVDAIAHGCTGKGNDQVRFELGIMAFAPQMKVIAPWRFWELNSREKEIAYAEQHGLKLTISRETNYSKDKNIWHLSHEGLDLEDVANKPKYEKILELCKSPQSAADKEFELKIGFKMGMPVSLNGKEMDALSLVKELNKIAGEAGVGILDLVENRLIGMKSRGVYETPAGSVLHAAHEFLEELCLDKDTLHFKQSSIAPRIAQLIYDGLWFSPLFAALSAFVEVTQSKVSGEVELILYKGNIIKKSVSSPCSLYSQAFATFDEDDIFSHAHSEGFISIFGLPTKVQALLNYDLKGGETALGAIFGRD